MGRTERDMGISPQVLTHLSMNTSFLNYICSNERRKNRLAYTECLTAMMCLNAHRNLLRKEVLKLFTSDRGEKWKLREVKVTTWPRVCGEAQM